MSRAWRYFVAAVLPVTGLSTLFGSCASTPSCNNDACYDRKIASVDPYRKGEIAAWGTELEVAKQEEVKAEQKRKRFDEPKRGVE